MRPTVLGLFLFCSLAIALPASAQIYRWVDDRGVVNYANKPPAQGTRATRIDTQESRVSVIPIAQPRSGVAAAALAATPAPAGFPGGTDRVTMDNLQAALDWRERCFAERRVDCTSPTAATYDFGASYSPISAYGPPLGQVVRVR
jgi:hypothetical protein